MADKKRRVLLVGWDAADWKVARPLMKAGQMPNLARIVAEGCSGNLATIHPPLSPMLWTSIATGKRPGKHGIHGFSEPTPDGTSVRPITTLGRTTKAIWNILHQSDLKPSVVGWWPSHPAEPIRGVMVSNLFHHAGNGPVPNKMTAQSVHPPEWTDRIAELRITPMELPGEAIHIFAPNYNRVDQSKDKRIHTLGRLIAETMTVHAAATEVLEFAEWDFAGIYYDAIDHFSHAFMTYHPPRQERVSDEEFDVYSSVVTNAYIYHDAMLGRLLELAGPDVTVIVMSDHGFHSDQLRPAHIPAEAAGPAIEHRDFGILAMRGPGIRAGETIIGATLLDITPTLLHLFGLPVGADMDGKVLITALDTPGKVKSIPSWDEVAGDAGTHPPHAQLDPVASAEAMKQLVDLGYVAPPGENAAENIAAAIEELKYNLARAYDDAGQFDRSIPLYEWLCMHSPVDQRYVERLFSARLYRREYAKARQLLDAFDQVCSDAVPEAEKKLAKRREKQADEDIDIRNTRERMERRQLLERIAGHVHLRKFLRLRLDLADGRTESAKKGLAEIEAAFQGHESTPSLRIAESYALLRDDAKAIEWTERALARNPEDWQALALAAKLYLRGRKPERALEAASASLALDYNQPIMHYIMGRALMRRGDFAQSESSFLTAVAQMPGLLPAHQSLVRLYDRHMNRPGAAGDHRHRVIELRRRYNESLSATPAEAMPALPDSIASANTTYPRRDADKPADAAKEIVVVAGLPRSGTSMLMQMLHDGGVPALTDGKRVADADNPRGYFEFEPATHIARDASWLPQSRGKVVKLALPLVQFLPPGESYRLLIIERDVREVIASQRKMLERLGRLGGGLSDEALAAEYARHREQIRSWLLKRPEVAVLPVRYSEILAEPLALAKKISTFLGRDLDVTAAADAVKPSLRRQFAGTKST